MKIENSRFPKPYSGLRRPESAHERPQIFARLDSDQSGDVDLPELTEFLSRGPRSEVRPADLPGGKRGHRAGFAVREQQICVATRVSI